MLKKTMIVSFILSFSFLMLSVFSIPFVAKEEIGRMLNLAEGHFIEGNVGIPFEDVKEVVFKGNSNTRVYYYESYHTEKNIELYYDGFSTDVINYTWELDADGVLWITEDRVETSNGMYGYIFGNTFTVNVYLPKNIPTRSIGSSSYRYLPDIEITKPS